MKRVELDEAISAHLEWRIRFTNAIYGHEQLDAGIVAKDDCCELGQWLQGEGMKRHGRVAEFRSLVDHHKNFHVQAGKVAELINSKRFAEAGAAITDGTPYADSSIDVGSAVKALRKAVGI